MSKRIFVTGATGFIGTALVRALTGRGQSVVVVSRDRERASRALGGAVEVVEGDTAYAGDWQQSLSGCDAVVNLAGQPIAGRRWNAHYRQLIHDSRVETTRHLVEAIAACGEEARPRALVSASGVDYYPFSVDLGAAFAADEDDDVDERSPAGDSVMARICRDWEAEARRAEKQGVRVVRMRTGIVLGSGGALERMTTPFKFLVGGRIGNGRQWFSWIHLEDAVAAYLFALDSEKLRGPVNLVAPEPVRNAELARTMGRVLKRPAWVPVPGFALRAAVGELSEYLLNGRRVVPAVLLERGFRFRFPDLESALVAAL